MKLVCMNKVLRAQKNASCLTKSNLKVCTPKKCTEKRPLLCGWSTCLPVSSGASETVTSTCHHQEAAGGGLWSWWIGRQKMAANISAVPSRDATSAPHLESGVGLQLL